MDFLDDNPDMDAQQLLAYLPEDVWRLILKEIKDPEDLETCINTSSYFRKLLFEQRVEFLFPKIFDHLTPHLENPNFSKISDNQAYYVFRSLANMRLVCKKWNRTIEDFLQRPGPAHLQMEHDTGDHWKALKLANKVTYKFTRRGLQPDRFVRRFEESHFSCTSAQSKNPFTARSISFEEIHLGEPLLPEMRGILNGIQDILIRYGPEIWYCNMTICETRPVPSEFYIKLREWLNRMPNLKAISLRYLGNGATDLSQLGQEIIESPLPEMRHLQLLKCNNLPSAILSELLKFSRNKVSDLEVKQVYPLMWSSHIIYDLHTIPLPYLTKLSMTISSEPDFEELEQFGGNWKLEKLYLIWRNDMVIEWPRTFNMISNHWGFTLTDLMIELPESQAQVEQVLEDSRSLNLICPLLQRLKLISKAAFSLDSLLLSLKDSLEVLELTLNFDHSRYEELAREQIIQIHGFDSRMPESNIWDLLPKLNIVKNSAGSGLAFQVEKNFSVRGKSWAESRELWF